MLSKQDKQYFTGSATDMGKFEMQYALKLSSAGSGQVKSQKKCQWSRNW
jgi:hypothetical protein